MPNQFTNRLRLVDGQWTSVPVTVADLDAHMYVKLNTCAWTLADLVKLPFLLHQCIARLGGMDENRFDVLMEKPLAGWYTDKTPFAFPPQFQQWTHHQFRCTVDYGWDLSHEKRLPWDLVFNVRELYSLAVFTTDAIQRHLKISDADMSDLFERNVIFSGRYTTQAVGGVEFLGIEELYAGAPHNLLWLSLDALGRALMAHAHETYGNVIWPYRAPKFDVAPLEFAPIVKRVVAVPPDPPDPPPTPYTRDAPSQQQDARNPRWRIIAPGSHPIRAFVIQ